MVALCFKVRQKSLAYGRAQSLSVRIFTSQVIFNVFRQIVLHFHPTRLINNQALSILYQKGLHAQGYTSHLLEK